MEKKLINKITYGFPSRENGQYLDDATIYDKYYSNFTNTPFFPNDSAETYKELLVISQSLSEKKDKKTDIYIDRSFHEYIKKQCKKQGVHIEIETITKIIMQVAPICMRLKVHYQRPRPFQLGLYANVPLFPFASLPAQAPAYPSGHACQSRYLALCLSALIPDKSDFFIKLSNYIADSRVYIGVHFPSDNTFGQGIAEFLFQQPETHSFLNSIAEEIKVDN